jgi:transcriptional regulator GlxA family with amidase domain
VEWHDEIKSSDGRRKKVAMLELESRFRRFALDNPKAARWELGRGTAGPVHPKVEQLARHIVEHFQEPIALAEIARSANLHPNYAANLFRKHCGQTLMQCLNQHRIAHAQRLLATTKTKVIDIAFDSGFGSVSQFYEAFARHCRETPANYRRRFSGQLLSKAGKNEGDLVDG